MLDPVGGEKRLRPRVETPGEGAELVEVAEGKEGLEGAKGTEREEGREGGQSEAEEAAQAEMAAKEQALRAAPTPGAEQKDPLTQEIEGVLQEELTDAFLAMPPAKQQEFKRAGEETTQKIRALVSQTKINARKILELIQRWLKLIPGVNKFFLEQAAKIKTDKILLVAEEEKKRGGSDLA